MEFPKTYRTNAGWALSIGATLALFSNLRNEQRAVISLAIIGALGFLWSAWEHKWIRWNHKSIPKALAILGLFSLIAWFAWPSLPEVKIFLTESRRLETTKVRLNHANPEQYFEDVVHREKPVHLYIRPEENSEVISVIFRNDGKASIKSAVVQIISNVPIKGLTDGQIDIAKSFSPYQVNYQIIRLDPFSETMNEEMKSISIPTPRSLNVVGILIIVDADDLHYASVGLLEFEKKL